MRMPHGTNTGVQTCAALTDAVVPTPEGGRAAEDVVAEGLQAVGARVAEVVEAEEVLDAAQQRVVVVRRVVGRAGLDEGREQHGADAAAAGTEGRRARVDRVVAP